MTHPADDPAVFVPLTLADWRQLVSATTLPGPLPAYGVTPGLVAWGGFGPDDTEDALFAAQSVAGVAALTQDEEQPDARRVVAAVAATGFRADTESALGAGQVAELELARVTAVFSDDPDVSVAAARAAARGRDVGEAWDDPVVAEFADAHDLGWYTVAEASAW